MTTKASEQDKIQAGWMKACKLPYKYSKYKVLTVDFSELTKEEKEEALKAGWAESVCLNSK